MSSVSWSVVFAVGSCCRELLGDCWTGQMLLDQIEAQDGLRTAINSRSWNLSKLFLPTEMT